MHYQYMSYKPRRNDRSKMGAIPKRCDDDSRPSQDMSERYPDDQKLRRHGFAIYSRPGGKLEPFWIRRGIIETHSQALFKCGAGADAAEIAEGIDVDGH